MPCTRREMRKRPRGEIWRAEEALDRWALSTKGGAGGAAAARTSRSRVQAPDGAPLLLLSRAEVFFAEKTNGFSNSAEILSYLVSIDVRRTQTAMSTVDHRDGRILQRSAYRPKALFVYNAPDCVDLARECSYSRDLFHHTLDCKMIRHWGGGVSILHLFWSVLRETCEYR